MAKDTSQPGVGSSQPSQRRPLTIDLAAEDVRRKETETQHISASEASPGTGDAAAPDAKPGGSAAAEPPKGPMPAPGKQENPAAEEPIIPSAFATSGRGREDAAPAREPGRRSMPFIALFVAALLGGALAAGGLLFLDRVQPQQESGADLAAEMATLRGEIAGLRQAGEEGGATDLAPLQGQIAALEQAIGEMRAAAPAGAADDELLVVQNRLAELERLAGAGSTAAGEGNAAIEARLAELSSQVEALRGGGTRDLTGLERNVAELRDELAALAARVEGAPTEERVATLEAALEANGRTSAQAAALIPAVAAGTLAEALDSGAPFQTELAALSGLGLDEAALASLQPYAETGLPTLAALRAGFETAVSTIDLAAPIPEGTGALDRLVSSARGLVEVRPAHPTAGTEPAAIVARIRGALEAGDLNAALADWSALPPEAQAKTAEWAEAAKARAAAEALAARLRSDALSRLGTEG